MNHENPSEPFDDACPLEGIRARAEGALTPEEARRLERQLAVDDELRAFAAEYAEVHALTEERGAVPRSATRFAELEPRLERAASPSPWQHVAGVAAVLLAVGVGALAWHALGDLGPRGPLHLCCVDLETTPVALGELPPIGGLGDYDPRDLDGDVAWLHDPLTAMWLSGLSQRPVLVYGAFPECPLAAVLDRSVFTEADVVSLFERYVPLRLDLSALPPEEADAMMARGYPFLEVWSPRGESIFPLTRAPVPADFVESMHDGLEAADATGDVPSWDDVRGLLALFDAACAAEAQGDMAKAEEAFVRLAAGPGEFALVGERGLARLAAEVREGLLAVRELATTDVERARERIARLQERYRGTRFAADIAAVHERLDEEGRFPEIASS